MLSVEQDYIVTDAIILCEHKQVKQLNAHANKSP